MIELVRDSLDHCVKCTICETFCPFSQVTPLFPGPKFVGPQAERYRGAGVSPDASVDYCSGCGICTQVCPQDVKIAEINSQARAQLWEERGIPLRNQLIARPSVLGRLGTPVAPLANWALKNKALRLLAHRLLGIHRRAPMPRLAGRSFQRWARQHRSPISRRRVVYFHGCGVNYYEPAVGEMVVGVLEHNGYYVQVPPQDCCGLPLQSNGNFEAARAYVRRLVANLAPYAREGVPIVVNSTSCGLMLKREAHEILGVEDDDLRAVSEATYDLCEFLLLMHERGELRTDFRPLPQTVPYHAPCQQRGHGIGKPALDLLALIPDLRVIELDADCCGIAGTYGLKKEKYEISMAVGERLFRDVWESGANLAACDSETCRWQIEHGAGVHAVHPVELLFRGYGLDAPAAAGVSAR
ncbi:MAG TPA: anaerobic glycerol-3-phosphate dehydrogenase subunit C [Gaiellaceae bacterium]|jgi:glycerol-3-phosphate dehydrogenase subunit C|nr:anaerobic glycerol-3-phosphate dehydrogenase subunit C [Gaiellaceae bacterium]